LRYQDLGAIGELESYKMARMIPPKPINPNTPSGEKTVFKRFRDDDTFENWFIFHSYHLEEHERKRESEADFIVFVPNKGIAVIEIKSHKKIKYEEGLWFFGEQEKEEQDPFLQAQEGMYAVKNTIDKHPSAPKNIYKTPFVYLVIFPNAKFQLSTSEYESWRLCDADDLNKSSLSKFILEGLNKQINHDKGRTTGNKFDRRTMEISTSLLRPKMLSEIETHQERNERINKEIFSLTAEQKNAIDTGTLNQRLLITGPAGTGKTLIATELAGKKSKGGEKVLFLCFNKLLAENLKNKYLNEKFDVYNFHSFLLKNSSLSVPANPDENFYDNELLNNSYEYVIQNEVIYDYIVIDEFQDLSSKDIFIYLDRILLGGLSGGNWTFLADFEKQVLFQRGGDPYIELSDFLSQDPPQKPLRVNCRNTPQVVEMIEEFTKIDPYYETNRDDVVTKSLIKPYENSSELFENLNKSINNLLKTYENKDILLLSPTLNGVIQKFQETNISLSPYNKDNIQNKSGPYYSTIKAFKGLEFNVVILVDFDRDNFISDKDFTDQLYTGLSRSLEAVHLHYSSTSANLIFGE
jgi:DNA polymerase III delta prime subunit